MSKIFNHLAIVFFVMIFISSCDLFYDENDNKANDEGIISLDVGNKYIFQFEEYNSNQDSSWYLIDSIISKTRNKGNTYYERSVGGWYRADNEKVYVKLYNDINSEEYLSLDYSVDISDTIEYSNNKYIVEAIIFDTLFNDCSEQKIITISNEPFNEDAIKRTKYSTKYGLLQHIEINNNWNDTLYKTLIGAKIEDEFYGEIK